ncbi:MAG: LacI family transcriptional regulator [Chloroflexi bacterium]|nr:LacI family transcriptional regulator [Chloroflexota bacterium]
MDNHSKKTSVDPGKVTIVDVARVAGVSYSTVSRVLNGYEFVKESTRQKVLNAAEQLGYVANQQARSLAGGKSRAIGLLVPGLDNGYVGEIIRGIDEEVAKYDYDLLLYTTRRNTGKESSYVLKMTRGLADGLLLIVPLVTNEYIEALQNLNFSYVLIDQSDPTDSSSIVDSTNWQGAYDATQYLIELGHTRIGFITGLMSIHSAGDRLDGYRAALQDHNIPYDSTLVVEGDFWPEAGYACAEALLDLPEPPTAIFASNDLSAFGTIEAARDRGLDIPRDLSIVGFDDIPQASLVYPQLTTVRQPLDQMGRIAARMLIEEIEEHRHSPRRVTLSTQLIVRNSCSPPAGGTPPFGGFPPTGGI